jgi:Cu+-exporting ATPase
LSDELRRGAKELISFLQEQKKDLVLVSGDNESSVACMAQQAGIEKVNANVLPKTKAEIVSNLRAMGKKVVMVGDGFNDIIALLQANAGIVFASGRNVYNNWVDVIINRRDLYSLFDLFKINKKLRHITMSNAFLAFGLNALLVVYLFLKQSAEAGWYWTVGGSLAVVLLIWLNSARLLKIK